MFVQVKFGSIHYLDCGRSLRSAEGSGLWNSSAGCREARSAYRLTRGQSRLCRATPAALAMVSRAASATLSVCQQLLRDRRWNCSSALNAPNFTPDLTTGRFLAPTLSSDARGRL